MFPYRLGSAEWFKVASGKEYYKADQTDYFSYDNLINAVAEVSNLKIKISTRQGTPSAQEIYRLDKDARVETLVVRSADFHSAENLNKTIETVIIDGGTFLREGFKKDRKRELAPSSPICPTRRAEAGLPHLEARSVGVCSGTRTSPAGLALIKTPSSILPALSCIPEHQTNAIMDGDRSCSAGTLTTACSVPSSMETKASLLDHPEIVATDGKIGYMTAILFWMTPQDPKPSAHDVIVGRWKPSPLEKFRGLGDPGFGTTVMVLNGLEANLDETEGAGARRAGHYRDITSRMGVDITGEKVGTLGMRPF